MGFGSNGFELMRNRWSNLVFVNDLPGLEPTMSWIVFAGFLNKRFGTLSHFISKTIDKKLTK